MKKIMWCSHVVAVVLLSAAGSSDAARSEIDGGFDVGLHVRSDANTKDAGLPSYPGARPYKEPQQTSSAANIGFSVPGFGLKVIAIHLQSTDEPARIAAFYRRAMAKYGAVLDCSNAHDHERSVSAQQDDERLVCDASDPGEHAFVYKVGTESNQRVVAIKPHASGTRFSVVYVNSRESTRG